MIIKWSFSGKSGDTLTLTGNNLAATGDESRVLLIGDEEIPCPITSQSDTSISCEIGEGPPGTYNVRYGSFSINNYYMILLLYLRVETICK